MLNNNNMIKEFFLRKMMESQLKNVPQKYRDKAIKAFSDNPDFFNEIAQEVKKLTQAGMSQMEAVQKVLLARQEEVKNVFGEK